MTSSLNMSRPTIPPAIPIKDVPREGESPHILSGMILSVWRLGQVKTLENIFVNSDRKGPKKRSTRVVQFCTPLIKQSLCRLEHSRPMPPSFWY